MKKNMGAALGLDSLVLGLRGDNTIHVYNNALYKSCVLFMILTIYFFVGDRKGEVSVCWMHIYA